MTLRISLLAAFALLLSLPINAQTCTGTLGENIFTTGDFGSGTANIVQVDPGIAPGFIYQRNPPPNDGFYTITNDIRRWADNFNWDAFPDNSSDPNGYMMVVNAAFAPGKFYEQQVDDLCENTLYQFTADIRNTLRRGTNGLMPNVSFSIDDVTRFTTGFIEETQTWNTYGFTFTTEPGQTSVVLALSNNAPGGIGNDLALDNISFRACGPEASITDISNAADTINICEDGALATLIAEINGDQYDDPALQWQQSFDGGMTWQDLAGENGLTFQHSDRGSEAYNYRFLLANGDVNLTNTKCRVISTIKTVAVVPQRFLIIDTICAGLTFTVGTSRYSNTGMSVDTLVSSLGCDSIVTLQLTVVPDPGIVPTFDLIDPTCSDRSDGNIELLDITNGAGPYDYVLDTLRRTIGSVVTGLSEGTYDYQLTDRYGCTTSGNLTLTSPNPFQIELGPDQVVSLGESVRLNSGSGTPIMSYSYTPANLINCTSDCEGVTFFPPDNTLVRLLASSTAGCVSEDSMRIIVVKDRLVYPPSAFSPNGDGINDRFTLFADTPNVTALARLRIFDRWGGQVFEDFDLAPNDVTAGWDGNLEGEAVPPGTYVYVSDVVFLDGAVERYSGTVVLVR